MCVYESKREEWINGEQNEQRQSEMVRLYILSSRSGSDKVMVGGLEICLCVWVHYVCFAPLYTCVFSCHQRYLSRTLHPVCGFTVSACVWVCMHDGIVFVCVVQRSICHLDSVKG